jgi:hypothetical protein
LKRDFGGFATFGAGRGVHLAWGSVTAVAVTFCLPCLAAFRAALGLVGVALGLEELLFLDAEGKLGSTIGTLEFLFL